VFINQIIGYQIGILVAEELPSFAVADAYEEVLMIDVDAAVSVGLQHG